MKKTNNILYAVFSLLTTFSFYKYTNYFINYYSLNIYLMFFIIPLYLLLFFLFYKKLYKDISLEKKYNIFVLILSFLETLGYSYLVKSNSSLLYHGIFNIINSVLIFIGFYYFLKTSIYVVVKILEKEYTKEYKIVNKYKEHPFIYSFIFLSICYSIYLIFYYPGIINYDNANQIKEVMGIHTRYLDAINPIGKSTLTNFNPIVHTLLLGNLFKFGYNIGNVNFGMFLFTLLQLITLITIYSYILSYSVKKLGKPLYSFISLLFIGLIPLFGFYSITLVKDTLYSAFLVLFCLIIYDTYKKENINYKDIFKLLIVGILVCLFRNNGFIVVFISLLFFLLKNNKLKILLLIFSLSIIYLSFSKVLLPKLEVSGTSIREALSIPFQQTARYVKYYEKDISVEEKNIINKVLPYDKLSELYKKDLADPVKNKYNKDATKEDLFNYFKVWFTSFFKHPLVYFDAWINTITGYFNPFINDFRVYHTLNRKLPEAGFNYHYNNLNIGREVLYGINVFVDCTPIGLILNIAVVGWLSILTFIMSIKNKKYIYLIPNIISYAFCFISPANAYYRYIYPSLIILVLLFPIIKKEIEKTNK